MVAFEPEQSVETLTLTTGLGFILMTTVDIAGPHVPGGSLDVSVSVTDPLVIEGVYVEFKLLGSEKLPLGAVQVALVAPPPIEPASVTGVPAQTV